MPNTLSIKSPMTAAAVSEASSTHLHSYPLTTKTDNQRVGTTPETALSGDLKGNSSTDTQRDNRRLRTARQGVRVPFSQELHPLPPPAAYPQRGSL